MTAPDQTPEQLVEQCQGLVRSLATRIRRKLPPNTDLEDLIAYGQVGLVEAARDFDPTRGSQFSTYAYYRIRGAIYDGLSKMTWFSRAQRKQVHYERMSNEVLRSEGEQGRQTANRSMETEIRWLRDTSRALTVVYLATHGSPQDEADEARLVDQSTPPPPAVAIGVESCEKLRELINALPPEAGTLIRATYFDGLTLQEAGQKIGVSKSWASRLHAKTLQRLARSLRLLEVTS